jgi:hypothetical protein
MSTASWLRRLPGSKWASKAGPTSAAPPIWDTGRSFYPALALGSTALVVLAAATLFWKPSGRRDILVSVGLSAGFMIIALPFSLKAVPFMQSLRSIHDGDVAALKQAFAGARFWGGFQGYFHIAAFCSELWAVAALARFGHRVAPDEIARTTVVRN